MLVLVSVSGSRMFNIACMIGALRGSGVQRAADPCRAAIDDMLSPLEGWQRTGTVNLSRM